MQRPARTGMIVILCAPLRVTLISPRTSLVALFLYSLMCPNMYLPTRWASTQVYVIRPHIMVFDSWVVIVRCVVSKLSHNVGNSTRKIDRLGVSFPESSTSTGTVQHRSIRRAHNMVPVAVVNVCRHVVWRRISPY